MSEEIIVGDIGATKRTPTTELTPEKPKTKFIALHALPAMKKLTKIAGSRSRRIMFTCATQKKSKGITRICEHAASSTKKTVKKTANKDALSVRL